MRFSADRIAGEVRAQVVVVRLSQRELDAYREAAQRERRNLSEWIRRQLNRAVRERSDRNSRDSQPRSV